MKTPRLSKADEAPGFLVPQGKPQGLDPIPDGDPRHALELRILIQALLEPVVRNSSAEVVDVMDPDAGCDPLERLGEHEMRTPLETRLEVRPVGVLVPIRIFELVLYVEEPHTDNRREHEHRKVNQQSCFEADRQSRQHEERH